MIVSNYPAYVDDTDGPSATPSYSNALASPNGPWSLIFIFAIFYFLLIMPQQRKQKKWQAMVNDLKTGDKVVTTGGLRGTVVSLKDDAVQLRVPPDNLRLEVTRASIASVAVPEDAAK